MGHFPVTYDHDLAHWMHKFCKDTQLIKDRMDMSRFATVWKATARPKMRLVDPRSPALKIGLVQMPRELRNPETE